MKYKQTIKDQNFPNERDLYGARDLELIGCRFDGVEDGESALKEANNISLIDCYMNLRYPLWHDIDAELNNVTMTDKCRAAMWYTKALKINNSRLLGIKALRECEDVAINNSQIISPEFGWRSRNIQISNVTAESEYLFLFASDIKTDNFTFKGKYSFQYVTGVVIDSSTLDTKDAFWHAKDVVVKDTVISGEYLAWYSENLTLINCKISGTQPFCYCKNLKLIDCEMNGCDLSFEYSDVEATINGEILSVKNPHSGRIVAKSIGELIYTNDSKYECHC